MLLPDFIEIDGDTWVKIWNYFNKPQETWSEKEFTMPILNRSVMMFFDSKDLVAINTYGGGGFIDRYVKNSILKEFQKDKR